MPMSALWIIDKLHVGNSHGLPAVGTVARQRVVQTPAIEHALEMCQSLGIGHVGHGQQSLELVAGDQEPSLDRLDRERFGGGGTAIDLERGQWLRRRFTLALLEHAPCRPEQVLAPPPGGPPSISAGRSAMTKVASSASSTTPSTGSRVVKG